MVQLDWATGEILDALESNGLAENTLVIFSSDNGPVYDDGYEDGTTVLTSTKEVDRGHDASGPYRGGKYQIYEGGTRVPFIVKWSGHIESGTSGAMVNQIDFIASFASLLNIELKDTQAPDSRNVLPALLGQSNTSYSLMLEEARRTVALRDGDWKYIPTPTNTGGELYNLKLDPSEQTNLIKTHAERAKQMNIRLKELVATKQGVRSATK